jgi:hypothetical protein
MTSFAQIPPILIALAAAFLVVAIVASALGY